MIRWEIIDEQPHTDRQPQTITDRLEVAGGHIIRTRVHGQGANNLLPASVAMVFVPSAGESSIYDAPPGGDAIAPHLSS